MPYWRMEGFWSCGDTRIPSMPVGIDGNQCLLMHKHDDGPEEAGEQDLEISNEFDGRKHGLNIILKPIGKRLLIHYLLPSL